MKTRKTSRNGDGSAERTDVPSRWASFPVFSLTPVVFPTGEGFSSGTAAPGVSVASLLLHNPMFSNRKQFASLRASMSTRSENATFGLDDPFCLKGNHSLYNETHYESFQWCSCESKWNLHCASHSTHLQTSSSIINLR